jgi:ribosomal protein L11 methyltransferase
MEYTKISCILTPDNELAREMLIAELGNTGFESFVETEEGIEAFIPSRDFTSDLMDSENLKENEFFVFNYTMEVIADQNWNEVWEQNYFEPLMIEDQCLVRAPFHENYQDATFEIIINPRMAFGTGNHETTHLMVKAMLEMELTGLDILDMGCGSGILSILSSMKGAKDVTAVDIDEWSTNNTTENAGLNNILNIAVKLGDASLLTDQKFDVILANIQRNIIVEDMPAYCKVLRPGGKLLMSGFYTKDLEMVVEKAESLELKLIESFDRSDWGAALFIK